ncbi:FAD-dependent protein, partial [Acinetobacter baumannii]
NKKLVGFLHDDHIIKAITTEDGDSLHADAYILATGHSARDIFKLLASHHITIEAKPFALGVRIEHPQYIIDQSQYHCAVRDPLLPP